MAQCRVCKVDFIQGGICDDCLEDETIKETIQKLSAKRSVNVDQRVSPIFGENYKLSDIIKLAELLGEINSTPLEQLRVFDDNGKQIAWDEEILKQWKFTGLNNFDFIRTEFYKNGFM